MFTSVGVTSLSITQRRLLQLQLATDTSNLFMQQFHLTWLHSCMTAQHLSISQYCIQAENCEKYDVQYLRQAKYQSS